jgi:hypothetical protein
MDPVDYDRLMHANLVRVFGERDSNQRIKAIGELYAENAVLYEPEGVATGHAAINKAVDALLSQMPPGVGFTATGIAVGHHGVGRLRWESGPAGGPVAVTGTDVAHVEGGKIQTLHVLLDPSGA